MVNDVANMTTLTTVLEKLRQKRQDNEFVFEEGKMKASNGKCYGVEDLKISRTYRFEGESNPSDNSILYLIEANDGLTGYSLDSYGAESNHEAEYDDFIRQLPVEHNDESASA